MDACRPGSADPRPGAHPRPGPPARLAFLRSDAGRRRACRQARRPPGSGRSAGRADRTRRRRSRGQSAAVVVDHDPQPPARRSAPSHTSPHRGSQAVLHRVLQQLGERHRQRGRHPESSTPNVSGAARAHRGSAAATSATIASSRSATSSKSTVSSTVWDSVSCTIAMEPTRRTASSSAARPPPGRSAAPAVAARRHGLQVVLHPVVDLADRRVLGDQLAFTPSYLGDVAAQHQGADVHPAGVQRDHPQRHERRRCPRPR